MQKTCASIIKSPFAPALFLAAGSGVFLLLFLLRYTLVLFTPAATVLSLTIIASMVLFTISGIQHRKEKSKTSALLPLLAILTSALFRFATEMHPLFYEMLIFVTLPCSIILFFVRTRSLGAKIALGVLYSYFAFVVLSQALFIFSITPLTLANQRETMQAEISPSGVYLAEVIARPDLRTGPLRPTFLTITRQNSTINFFIGELRTDYQSIVINLWPEIRWGRYYEITLRWETDELLFAYAGPYPTMISRENNRWIVTPQPRISLPS